MNPTNIKPEVGQKWKHRKTKCLWKVVGIEGEWIILFSQEQLRGTRCLSIEIFREYCTLTHLADGTEVPEQVEFEGYEHTGEFRLPRNNELVQYPGEPKSPQRYWDGCWPEEGKHYWILKHKETQPEPETEQPEGDTVEYPVDEVISTLYVTYENDAKQLTGCPNHPDFLGFRYKNHNELIALPLIYEWRCPNGGDWNWDWSNDNPKLLKPARPVAAVFRKREGE